MHVFTHRHNDDDNNNNENKEVGHGMGESPSLLS